MLEFLITFLPSNPIWILGFILVCLLLFKEYARNKGLPPGPYGLPFFGYMFFVKPRQFSNQLKNLCEEYKTDILSMSLLRTQLIVLNSMELMKEVYQKRTDATDRPEFSLFSIIDVGFTGIIGTSGKQWKEVRRFSISALRDFGMGRVAAEEQIQREAKILCDTIKKHKNEPINPKEYINIAVSNIICGIVFGQRFGHDNDEFLRALDGMNKLIVRFGNPAIFFLLRYDIFRKYILNNLFKQLESEYEQFATFVRNRIKEHKDTFTGERSDVIYSYLKIMEEGRDPDIFDEKMLESLIVDYFFAGSETTYTTLRWALLAMSAYPDVQKKVQQELDQVVGDREISMSDKKLMPYCEATLCEVQRHYTLAPLGAGHCNLSEIIEISGYRIPQNSIIIPNLNKFHHDKEAWKNPNEFDPENFLENGKVVNLEKLVPFGVGRRSCAGEALARMEIFLFFTTLVKSFDIKPETDDTVPNMTGQEYAVLQPEPFKIRMKSRY